MCRIEIALPPLRRLTLHPHWSVVTVSVGSLSGPPRRPHGQACFAGQPTRQGPIYTSTRTGAGRRGMAGWCDNCDTAVCATRAAYSPAANVARLTSETHGVHHVLEISYSQKPATRIKSNESICHNARPRKARVRHDIYLRMFDSGPLLRYVSLPFITQSIYIFCEYSGNITI